jgi:hypothetical protein
MENKPQVFRGAFQSLIPFLPFATFLSVKDKKTRLFLLIGAILGSIFMVNTDND